MARRRRWNNASRRWKKRLNNLAVYGAVAVLAGLLVAEAAPVPVPFKNATHIVCVDLTSAAELATVFEQGPAQGESFLAGLAKLGACDWATFTGKPVADLYSRNLGKQRELHVFSVDVARGLVLGRARVYMLLVILRDNEA